MALAEFSLGQSFLRDLVAALGLDPSGQYTKITLEAAVDDVVFYVTTREYAVGENVDALIDVLRTYQLTPKLADEPPRRLTPGETRDEVALHMEGVRRALQADETEPS